MEEDSKPYKRYTFNYSRFFTLTVLVSPILDQYISGIPGVTLAELLLGISCIFLLINKGLTIPLAKSKPLIAVWFMGMLLTVFSLFIQQSITFESITRMLRYTYYIFLVLIALKHFDFKYALKTLKFLTILVSGYIIAQTIMYHLIGVLLPFKILPIPLIRDIDIEYMMHFAKRYYLRPTGIFVEPGYAAQFLLPGFVLALFGWFENNKIDIKNVILIFLALILTTSSQAIFLGGLILCGFLFHKIKSNKSRSGIIKNFILIGIAILLFLAFLNINNVELALRKVTGEIRPGSSFALRIFRGFAVFNELPLINKIIGVGHGNLGTFVIKNNIVTKFDPINITMSSAEYTNGIAGILLYYGFIGFAFFINFYVYLFRRTNSVYKLIVVLFIGVSLVADVSFSLLIVFYYSLIYASMSYKEKKHITDYEK